MNSIKIDGELEIDQDRGVIYFHSSKGITLLRICNLPRPIPEPNEEALDITHMFNASWRGIRKLG